jgi:hypothetical protein
MNAIMKENFAAIWQCDDGRTEKAVKRLIMNQ